MEDIINPQRTELNVPRKITEDLFCSQVSCFCLRFYEDNQEVFKPEWRCSTFVGPWFLTDRNFPAQLSFISEEGCWRSMRRPNEHYEAAERLLDFGDVPVLPCVSWRRQSSLTFTLFQNLNRLSDLQGQTLSHRPPEAADHCGRTSREEEMRRWESEEPSWNLWNIMWINGPQETPDLTELLH